jgi:class 3 adenylate cyclase
MMVVVGENTYEAVKGLFEVRALGKVTLKGKAIEVTVYEVIGPIGAAEATSAVPGAPGQGR